MKQFLRLWALMLIFSFGFGVSLFSQVSGTVFRDYDRDGTQDALAPAEPGIPGIIVNAYNAADVLAGTTTSGANGAYTLTIPNGSYRIEFVLPANGCFVSRQGTFPGTSGSVYGTTTRFITLVGSSANNNLALASPSDYYTTANPDVGVSLFIAGNATGGGTAGTFSAFQVFPYNTNQNAPLVKSEATNSQIGTVWGNAYSRQAGRFFLSAMLKRHAGMGPLGPSGIYILDSLTNTVTDFIDLSTVGAAASGTGAYHYNDGRIGSGTNNQVIPFNAVVGANTGTTGTAHRGLPANVAAWPGATTYSSYDAAAFAQAGRISLGGLEISDDGRFLYVINLFTRSLITIDLRNPYVPQTPGAAQITVTAIPTPSGLTGGEYRPWALKYFRGRLYIGGISDASTSGLAADLRAYVYEYDPVGGTFTGVINGFALNYTKGTVIDIDDGTAPDPVPAVSTRWYPWTYNYNDLLVDFLGSGQNRKFIRPQPLLSDIEFDDADGSMVLGFMDRTGLQVGYRNWGPRDVQPDRPNQTAGSPPGAAAYTSSSATNGAVEVGGGDILRFYKNPTGCVFNAESNGVSNGINGSGNANGQGPGGGEFFGADAFNTTVHPENIVGALAVNYGSRQVMSTVYDAFNTGTVNSGGVKTFSHANGALVNNGYNIYSDVLRGVTFAKGVGLGDIEFVGAEAPLEIGNRIWNDANGDGIQNADEVGINGVVLEIFVDADKNGVPDGAAIGTTTTATIGGQAGSWFFDDANITLDGNPNQAGVQDRLANGVNYIVRLATSGAGNDWDPTANGGAGGPRAGGDLVGFRLTTTDQTGNGEADYSDNDAALVASIPQISYEVGGNNQTSHNLDFGFKQLGAIGDRVWLDNGTGTGGVANDGLQNGNEPGVAGVTVELFLNGTRIASTVTDAYGNYFFDNLATGGGNIYTVKVTPPANYRFTTQTNTAGDQPSDATGSDINPVTLASYNIILTAGETERDIDAGLVFNPAPTLLSIGDRVWYDNGQGGGTANDGIQNGTEPGVSGITVTLFRDINGDGDVDDPNEIIGTTVTDANGNYLFTGLPPNTNNYKVGFSLPPTFIFSPKDAGGNDATDSDVNTAAGVNFGKTDFFNLVTSDINTIDAGINNSTAVTTASVGDRVWNDVDRDGVQDADEPGIEGVLVTLLQNGSPVATTRTDAFGNFEFTNLTPGTGYEIVITSPTGYTITTQNQTAGGGNDNNDSDVSTGGGTTGTFGLVAGQRKDFDAGLYNNTTGLNSIGNFVWNDLDADGVQDANEPGVPGVSVLIRTSAGAQVDNPARAGTQDYVVTTDENGFYRFTDLPDGNYVLFFQNLPAGYTVTTPIGAGDNGTNTNSDATAASGSTAIYNLAGGEYDQTVDCGIVRGSAAGGPSIGNRVWYDLDNDGIQDAPSAGVAPELGVAGVTVTLVFAGPNGVVGGGDDVAVATTTTDALGNYLFTSGNVPGGLTPGIPYYIQFTGLPTGYSFSGTQNAGGNDEVDSDVANVGTGTTGIYILGPTEENLTVDAGINNLTAGLGSISNLVFFDIDGDGVQDAGEPGVQGVTVRLFNDGPDGIPGNADDVFVGVTTTDVNGNYLFDGLPADNYTVYFSNYPAGFGGTLKDQGGDDALDSDAPGTVKTDGITLAAGQDRTDVDFGIRSTTTAALGNFVWFDSDNDGVQDAGEAGIPGVTVLLYLPSGGSLPVASAITDANGGYLFTNLVPGTYELEFINIPGGTTFTQQNTPGDNGNNTNSDVNPATGRTGGFVLTAGEVDLTVDAGVRRQTTATVGNFVWYDLTPNGTRDANEPPVPGILVTLRDGGGNVVASAITGNDGSYLFTNVTPGTYTIQFSNLPAGSNFTTQNVGGAGADNNSNPDPGTGITLSFTVPAGGADITIDAGLIGTPLPAEGLSLIASLNGGRVQLNWKTISENGTAYFEIERSFDNNNFTKLGGNIAAAGSSAFERSYNSTDDLAGVQNNTIYYRVKLYDQNGAFKFSNVAVVRLKGGGIKVWPNPFAEVLQVNITTQGNAVVELRLSDAAGRIVMVQRQAVNAGTSQIALNNLSRLANGTYTLQVVNETEKRTTTYKLNKQD